MAVRGEAGDQRVAVDAVDRQLAGGVDIGYQHRVGVVEAGAEPVEQLGEPRVAVRLNDGDHLAFGDRPRRLQHRGDLDRVVAVIVDDRDAVPLAGLGKAALHALERAQARAHHRVGDPHLGGDGDRGQRILHVVVAEHRQEQIVDGAGFAGGALGDDGVEFAAALTGPDVDRADIGLRAEAVGDDAPLGQLGDHPLHDRMVDAQHGKAVERDVADKALEPCLQRGEIAVIVEMLGVDVGDDRDRRRQLGEGAVALVGLDHHPVACAEPRVGAVGVDDPAVDHGRVELRGFEQRADHRGRRGLAVGAGDRDRPFEAHQLAQHLGAAHHRHAAGAGGDDLGVVGLDRRRDDDDLGGAEVLRACGRP